MSPSDTHELIRAHLDALLASPQFSRAKRSASLLRFLVERTLAGESQDLKEYTLGVAVFGRDESFDPRIDALVRVEANRLRARLKSYYEGPGAGERVRIEVPLGSYIPVFAIGSGRATAPVRRVWTTSRAVMLTVVGLSLTLVAGWLGARLAKSGPPSLLRLRRLTSDSGITAYPAMGPAGLVVYSSDRGGRNYLHLWKQAAGGGDPVELTTGDHNDTSASVSPDGGSIAYQSDRDGGGVFLIPSSGGKERLVAHFGFSPRFSPDAKWLTYWAYAPATTFGSVYVTRVDTPMEPIRVAREFDDAHNPVWTPDGKNLLICGTRRTRGGTDEEHDLWVVPADGGRAQKTDAFARLEKAGLDPHTLVLADTSFQWMNGNLLFSARSADDSNLWRLPIGTDWKAKEEPTPLATATNQHLHPAVWGSGIAFTSATLAIGVWSLPLEANEARVNGTPRRLTESREALSPSISADGQTIVFLAASGNRQFGVWKIGAQGSHESEISRGPGPTNRIKLSADGKTAFYRVLEGGGLQQQVIYSTSLASGATKKVCANCGGPTHVTPDGRLVIYEAPNTIPRLGAVRVATGEKWEFLEHSHHGVMAGRVSADGAWIAFYLDRGRDGKQIYVAPFHDAAPIPERSWIPVTAPEGLSEEPWWSPNGRYLYYLSERDGWRCVWAQALDEESERAVGPPLAIQHFHQPRLTPLFFIRRTPQYVGLSVAGNQLVLSLSEITSNVWIGEMQE